MQRIESTSCGAKNCPTGGTVYLHGIIRRRIVACRDHDAAVALIKPNGKGEFRRASVAVQEENLETRRRHDAGAEFGKMPGTVPGVISNRTRVGRFIQLFFNIVGPGLGRSRRSSGR